MNRKCQMPARSLCSALLPPSIPDELVDSHVARVFAVSGLPLEFQDGKVDFVPLDPGFELLTQLGIRVGVNELARIGRQRRRDLEAKFPGQDDIVVTEVSAL